MAESFFATIKTEMLDRQPWPTKATAHKAIFEYVEGPCCPIPRCLVRVVVA